MRLIALPICFFCRHFDVDHYNKMTMGSGLRCKAFSERIPIEITSSRFDHRFRHPKDNGITFEIFTNQNNLIEFLATKPPEEVEHLLNGEFKRLEEGRNAGSSLPPISNDPEERFLALLRIYNSLDTLHELDKLFRLESLPVQLVITLIKEEYKTLDPEIKQKYILPSFDEIGK